MSVYNKPLPAQVKGTVTKEYWEALKEGKFKFQKCDNCNTSIFYPRVVCPSCMSEKLSWKEASGKGEIYSYTVVYKAINPAFKEDLPYTVGLIDLAEGIRVMGNIIGTDDPESLKVGQAVKIEFSKVTDDFTFPVFRVVEEANQS